MPDLWLPGTHLHVYREGFEDRVAYLLDDVPEWHGSLDSGVNALEGFLRFCAVDPLPPIQTAV
jgi:hypothetical protein